MGKCVCANNGDEVHYLTFPCPFYEKITNSLLISSHNNDENWDIEQKAVWIFKKNSLVPTLCLLCCRRETKFTNYSSNAGLEHRIVKQPKWTVLFPVPFRLQAIDRHFLKEWMNHTNGAQKGGWDKGEALMGYKKWSLTCLPPSPFFL